MSDKLSVVVSGLRNHFLSFVLTQLYRHSVERYTRQRRRTHRRDHRARQMRDSGCSVFTPRINPFQLAPRPWNVLLRRYVFFPPISANSHTDLV